MSHVVFAKHHNSKPGGCHASCALRLFWTTSAGPLLTLGYRSGRGSPPDAEPSTKPNSIDKIRPAKAADCTAIALKRIAQSAPCASRVRIRKWSNLSSCRPQKGRYTWQRVLFCSPRVSNRTEKIDIEFCCPGSQIKVRCRCQLCH